MPHIIYADLECLLRSIYNCQPSNDNSFQMNENVHILSGYALYMFRSYDENLITHYRGVDCMQKFVKALEIMIMMLAKTEKHCKIRLSENEEYVYNCSDKCYICDSEFDECSNNPKEHKIKDYCYYTGEYKGAVHRKCSNKCNEERQIPVVFHNGSNYDYHFVIKEKAKQVDGLECIGENSEKYITFKALFNKQCKNGKKVTYKLKFIDSFRFTLDSLQNFVDNLTELNKCGECSKECSNYKRRNNLLIYRCNKCKKRSYKSIHTLVRRCPNVYSMCNGDLDKFLLLLRKGVSL